VVLTVTLNAALDITYGVETLAVGLEHRVASVDVRAGGKGINVARTLAQLGGRPLVTGFVGGGTGREIVAELDRAGLEHALVPIGGHSRRNVAVVDRASGEATVLNEPGPLVSGAEWSEFVRRFRSLAARSAAVSLSGSLPPGLPPDAYATLARIAAEHGVPAALDADGAALSAGLAARPALAKVNLGEAHRATGESDPWRAVEALRRLGAQTAVITRGELGMLACTAEGSWAAAPPERVSGNPTGAGDAAMAALVVGLVDGSPWPERLGTAVAASAAAVAGAAAGDLDLELYSRCLQSS
jgi:tagatose 6-phosphate kinase